MKYLKLFKNWNYSNSIQESSRYESLLKIINNVKIGDILPESTIYQYVQEIHDYEEGFIDGDLGERIEEYSQYKLLNVKLDDIYLDDYYLDEDEALKYGEMFKETNYYPPIVLDKEYYIIDGNHRANGLKMVGEEYVKAFVGSST
jgi:hypothetical protein